MDSEEAADRILRECESSMEKFTMRKIRAGILSAASVVIDAAKREECLCHGEILRDAERTFETNFLGCFGADNLTDFESAAIKKVLRKLADLADERADALFPAN